MQGDPAGEPQTPGSAQALSDGSVAPRGRHLGELRHEVAITRQRVAFAGRGCPGENIFGKPAHWSNGGLAREQPERRHDTFQVIGGQRGDRPLAHESLVRDGANLINQQIGFFRQLTGRADRDSQWVAVSMSIPVNFRCSGNDDGGAMPGLVQQVGLQNQSGTIPLSRLFLVRLRLEVHLPDFPPLNARQARLSGKRPSLR